MIGMLDLIKMYFNFNHYLTWIGIGIGLITIYTLISKFIFGKFSFKSLFFIIIIIFLALFLIKTIFFNPYAKNSEYCNKLITKTDDVLKKVDECIKSKTEFGNELLNTLNIYNDMLKDLQDIKDLNIQQQTEIKTKIATIETAITQIKTDIETKNQAIIKLETIKESKIKAKTEIDNQIDDLTEKLKVETNPNIRAKLKEQIAILEKEQDKLTKELIDIDLEIKKLNNEIDFLNSSLNNLEICKSTLEFDLKRLQKINKNVDFQIDSIEKRKERIQIEINENEIKLQELKIKKRNYENSKKTLNELLTYGKTYELENAFNLKNIDKSVTNLANNAIKFIGAKYTFGLGDKVCNYFSKSSNSIPIIDTTALKVPNSNQILEQTFKSKTVLMVKL
ncbi:hypothetical protein [Candidatus Phytoplasma pyri]|uniref:hypothetical protein n=1 Tax=Candidatus Phytoplasma pyri TaxID=47566 RepID=UPI0039838842